MMLRTDQINKILQEFGVKIEFTDFCAIGLIDDKGVVTVEYTDVLGPTMTEKL